MGKAKLILMQEQWYDLREVVSKSITSKMFNLASSIIFCNASREVSLHNHSAYHDVPRLSKWEPKAPFGSPTQRHIFFKPSRADGLSHACLRGYCLGSSKGKSTKATSRMLRMMLSWLQTWCMFDSLTNAQLTLPFREGIGAFGRLASKILLSRLTEVVVGLPEPRSMATNGHSTRN